jgi:hypothetical protein
MAIQTRQLKAIKNKKMQMKIKLAMSCQTRCGDTLVAINFFVGTGSCQ